MSAQRGPAIRLYLVRHSTAVAAGGRWLGDAGRGLTAEGRSRFRRVAAAFAALPDERVHLLFTSPLVRAVQTAEILAQAAGIDEVRVLAELRPDTAVGDLLAALATAVEAGQGVALVTHEPLVSRTVAGLARLPVHEAVRVEFGAGAVARVDVDALPHGPGRPVFWLDPRTCGRHGGAPIRMSEP